MFSIGFSELCSMSIAPRAKSALRAFWCLLMGIVLSCLFCFFFGSFGHGHTVVPQGEGYVLFGGDVCHSPARYELGFIGTQVELLTGEQVIRGNPQLPGKCNDSISPYARSSSGFEIRHYSFAYPKLDAKPGRCNVPGLTSLDDAIIHAFHSGPPKKFAKPLNYYLQVR